MNNAYENLKRFFEEIKNITFLKRIFKWNYIKTLSYDAFSEFELLITSLKETEQEIKKLEVLENDNKHFKSTSDKIEGQLEGLRQNNERLTKENSLYEQREENRKKDYEKNITEINTLKSLLESDRLKVQEEKEEEIINRFEQAKQTWAKHEENIENTIKEICRKHTIEYIDKEQVPFKGKPDNTLKICDEYIIFDAKSPANNDLDNFPNYIKLQTESVKKYIKEENVRKEIFLVIPSNTVQEIEKFTYDMADYTVYIITIDALEPIILSLKKIEDYEFTDQLSPEERENICRVIGKFTHITKRKIEVDQYFASEILAAIRRNEISLPKEISEKVLKFEISEKLNPPSEKRAKQISTLELEEKSSRLNKEIENETLHISDINPKSNTRSTRKSKLED